MAGGKSSKKEITGESEGRNKPEGSDEGSKFVG